MVCGGEDRTACDVEIQGEEEKVECENEVMNGRRIAGAIKAQ